MLPETTGRDSATARHVSLHAMLTTTGNRRRCDKHIKASKAEKHVIVKLQCLWHLLIYNVCPTITCLSTKRAAVGGHFTNSKGLCVAHVLFLPLPMGSCKHRSPITVRWITTGIPCNNYARGAAGTLFA